MDAPVYVEILKQTLVPFIEEVFPDSHLSKLGQQFFKGKKITWWKTPPESPDLNPIENLRHELKEYLQRMVKRLAG